MKTIANETSAARQKELENRINELQKNIRSTEASQGTLNDQVKQKDKRINELERILEVSQKYLHKIEMRIIFLLKAKELLRNSII